MLLDQRRCSCQPTFNSGIQVINHNVIAAMHQPRRPFANSATLLVPEAFYYGRTTLFVFLIANSFQTVPMQCPFCIYQGNSEHIEFFITFYNKASLILV